MGDPDDRGQEWDGEGGGGGGEGRHAKQTLNFSVCVCVCALMYLPRSFGCVMCIYTSIYHSQLGREASHVSGKKKNFRFIRLRLTSA